MKTPNDSITINALYFVSQPWSQNREITQSEPSVIIACSTIFDENCVIQKAHIRTVYCVCSLNLLKGLLRVPVLMFKQNLKQIEVELKKTSHTQTQLITISEQTKISVAVSMKSIYHYHL